MIKSKDVIGLFVAVKEEEKKEEAPPPVEEAAPAEEDEGEAKKKKKKKKKLPLQRKMRERPRRRRRRRRRPPSKWLFQYLNEASEARSFPIQAGRSDSFLLESWAGPDADFSATFVTFLKSSI